MSGALSEAVIFQALDQIDCGNAIVKQFLVKHRGQFDKLSPQLGQRLRQFRDAGGAGIVSKIVDPEYMERLIEACQQIPTESVPEPGLDWDQTEEGVYRGAGG